MAVVVKTRTCRQCGASFDGGPRAWYCPTCRAERKREATARYRGKGRKADRPIGSTDKCVVCGTEYVVKCARQKYCPGCAYEAVRAVDRPASRAWNQAHKDTYYPDRNARRKAARRENPDEIREKERQYWAANKDKLSEKNARAYRRRKGKEAGKK